MTNKYNIGSLNVNIPDYNSKIGVVIDKLTNDYEAGKVSSIFIVYCQDNHINVAVTGKMLELPTLSLIAQEVGESAIEQVLNPILGYGTDENE